MRCQGGYSGTGNEGGHVLYNRAILRHKTATKLLIFVFSFDSNNKLNDLIVGVLLETGRMFLMTQVTKNILYEKVSGI